MSESVLPEDLSEDGEVNIDNFFVSTRLLSATKVRRLLLDLGVSGEQLDSFAKTYLEEQTNSMIPVEPTDEECKAVDQFLTTGDFLQLKRDVNASKAQQADAVLRRVTVWRARENAKTNEGN